MARYKFIKSAALALGLAAAASSQAGMILDNGTLRMGVQDNGALGFGGVGISLTGGPGDAITPGCLCEGWGAGINGNGGYTYGFSQSGIASSSFGLNTDNLYESVVSMTNGLEVRHTYSTVAGGNLFKVAIEMINNSGAVATDVRYSRTLDWDVPPGHFTDDFTTIYGGSPTGPAGNVLHTSFDPFAVPNPYVLRSVLANQNAVDQSGDLGAYFVLAFDDLGVGESVSFETFIGADFTTSGLLSAFGTAEIEAYSYTYDNNASVTYGWGFAGIGLTPALPNPSVPAPAPLALMALGLCALGLIRRHQK